MKERLPLLLLLLYLVEFTVLGIHPYDRSVWWAENIPILVIVAALVLTYRRFRFSNTAYVMMGVLVFLHTIGGHYTFERVPFGIITSLFGFARNHFDRLSHFSVGFYAYAAAELLLARKWTSSRWVLFLFPVFMIFTVASVYEIIEWQYAVHAAPDLGTAFLGSQGDVWDAQADMLADGLGSIAATILFFLLKRKSVREM
jgi:putative membrane protein